MNVSPFRIASVFGKKNVYIKNRKKNKSFNIELKIYEQESEKEINR